MARLLDGSTCGCVALRIVEGHPFGGVGLGNFQTVEPSYATQTLNLTIVRQIVTERLVVHNTYLQIAADLGLVGLGLFLAILALPLRLAGRALRRLELEHHELEFHVRGLTRRDDRHAQRVCSFSRRNSRSRSGLCSVCWPPFPRSSATTRRRRVGRWMIEDARRGRYSSRAPTVPARPGSGR